MHDVFPQLVLLAQNTQNRKNISKKCRDQGGNAFAFCCNVAEQSEIDQKNAEDNRDRSHESTPPGDRLVPDFDFMGQVVICFGFCDL